jgi:hypothetical protein
VLEELTRHAISAWLADLAETSEASTIATRLVTEGELEVAPTEGHRDPQPAR